VRSVSAVRSVRAALGAARYLDCDVVLNLPDLHPTGHAALQLDLTLDDDVITACDPRIGLMHRSAEKLFEARDYRQVLMLASRHDWLGPFSGEHGAALVIEEALGITPPERARWSRTLLAELTRVSAALAFLAAVDSTVVSATSAVSTSGPPSPEPAALMLRERIIDHLEQATGNRVHPTITRIGGIALPLRAGWLGQLTELITATRASVQDLAGALDGMTHLAGLAEVSQELALSVGASGPVGSASGVTVDARLLRDYDAYPECRDLLRPFVRASGDAQSRYAAFAHDALIAMDIIERCRDRLLDLGDGPVDVPLPKVIRVPDGQTYRMVQTPLGTTGLWLLSVGERSPWRLKLRTPSFSNIQAMAAALVGVPLEHAATAVASFFLVAGDIDR